MSLLDKETVNKPSPAEAAPVPAVTPDAAPAKQDFSTLGNLTVVTVMAIAIASGFWLPKKFNVDYLTAGFIGLGIGTVVAMVGAVVYLYLRMVVWPRKRVLSESERAAAWNAPEVQKMVADLAADEKLLGIDKENEEAVKAIMVEQDRAWQQLVASEDFKSMTKEQQEVRAKQFAGEWMPRFAADAKARSQDIASRVLELRKRREREGS